MNERVGSGGMSMPWYLPTFNSIEIADRSSTYPLSLSSSVVQTATCSCHLEGHFANGRPLLYVHTNTGHYVP